MEAGESRHSKLRTDEACEGGGDFALAGVFFELDAGLELHRLAGRGRCD